jgi:hypothetical protein
MSVDGLSTMAERNERAGLIRAGQRLARMRSIGRRFGALARDRFKIDSWCFSSSDSETIDRAPPGSSSLAIVAMR